MLVAVEETDRICNSQDVRRAPIQLYASFRSKAGQLAISEGGCDRDGLMLTRCTES